MAFRLALAFGVWDVDRLMEEMPARLFAEWMAYWRIEPWGEQRADLRMGILASIIANVHSSGRRFRPRDFMPFEPEEFITEEEFIKRLEAQGGSS